jgi:hypothetical protein
MKFIMLVLAAALAATAARAQTQTPFCQGSNRALQFGPNGWVCATIAGVIGPQGPQGEPGPQGAPGPTGPAWQLPASPPTSECITARWDGTQWVCIPTSYLEAR